jgi:mevalonate kinase
MPALRPQKAFYPAKILLFGEHIINRGSGGLAVPFHRFSGYLTSSKPGRESAASNHALRNLAEYLVSCEGAGLLWDLNRFLEEVEQGLYFESDIPQGYGMGSSGALCAAVYQRFKKFGESGTAPDYALIRSRLCLLEDYFHGKSSGLDALVSLLGKAVVITADQRYLVQEQVVVSPPELDFFLLDSGLPRSTQTLVRHFLKRSEQASFASLIKESMVPLQQLCMEHLLAGNSASLWSSFRMLSQVQFDHMQEFIPETCTKAWQQGLSTGAYHLKICGAGGGGFLLGICRKGTDIQGLLPGMTVLTDIL